MYFQWCKQDYSETFDGFARKIKINGLRRKRCCLKYGNVEEWFCIKCCERKWEFMDFSVNFLYQFYFEKIKSIIRFSFYFITMVLGASVYRKYSCIYVRLINYMKWILSTRWWCCCCLLYFNHLICHSYVGWENERI